MGLPFVIASVGIALGVVFLVKGKVAVKIYGNNDLHESSISLALLCFVLAAIKGGSQIMEYHTYKSLGYEMVATNSEDLLPILLASLVWSCIIFICVVIRNLCRKSKVNEDIA
ncbi:MAG: hypothetical protein HDS84_01140 [Bacteroidales bacterium]|nr:hypothetical protein [Bacteroidales bacterium]